MEKKCENCGIIKSIKYFDVKENGEIGYKLACKACFRKYSTIKPNERAVFRAKVSAYSAKRRAEKLERIPSWSNDADLKAIRKIYARCKRINKLTGVDHQVDHVIPMKGKNISGLHHSTNLAIIPAVLNASKSNKWEFSEVNYG